MIEELRRGQSDRTGWIELREERLPDRVRWGVRAAQWRALELARAVFGGSVAIRLDGFPPRGAFNGLVHLRVPFSGLTEHRELESHYSRCVARDEVLSRVPLVFVFELDPDGEPARSSR